MNIYFTLMRLLFWVTLLALIASCNTRTVPLPPAIEIESRLFIRNAPDWVNNGSGLTRTNDERLIRGIGYSPVVGDLAKQKAIADDIARAEVERLLASFLSAMSGRFYADTSTEVSGVQSTQISEAERFRQIHALVRLSTSSTRIIKSWRNPENNAVWSLALLDVKRLRNIADGQNGVDKNFLHFLEAEADNTFDSFINQQ